MTLKGAAIGVKGPTMALHICLDGQREVDFNGVGTPSSMENRSMSPRSLTRWSPGISRRSYVALLAGVFFGSIFGWYAPPLLLNADEHAAPSVPPCVADGKADDTAALQQRFDKSGEVQLPRGIYRITRPLVIDLDKVGPVSLAGNGVARIVMAGPGPAIRLIGTHQGTADPSSFRPNVWERQRTPTIDGLEIVGDHPEAVGIEANGTMQLTVTRLTVREALDGIRLVGRNRNVIVSNCHLYHNRGVGLHLDGVDLHQINVSSSHISYNPGGGVVVRGGNVRNLQISGSDIEANRFNVLLDSAGSASGVAEVSITGCTLQHSGGDDSANVRFIGADRDGRPAWGHLTIADNIISDVHVNIDIQKALGVCILGNTLGVGYRYNLRIQDSCHVAIGHNVLARNPKFKDDKQADNGVLLSRCEDVTLGGLEIHRTHRTEAGLVLVKCHRVNVTGCSILDCDTAGVVAKDLSHSRISGCLIRHDRLAKNEAWTALEMTGGSGNMVVDNLLSGPPLVDPQAGIARGNMIVPATDGGQTPRAEH